MHVLVFLTFGISFSDWEKSGLLSREILLYKKLNQEKEVDFTFVTFGDSRDQEIIKAANKAKIKMFFTGIRHFNH